jgi:hypothetical protein
MEQPTPVSGSRWAAMLSKLKHGWWGWVVSALAAFFATLAPTLIRVLCLLFAVVVACATLHRTEFVNKRWKVTIPALGLLVIVAVGLFRGARYFDRSSETAGAHATTGVTATASQSSTTSQSGTSPASPIQPADKQQKDATHKGKSTKASKSSKPTEQAAIREPLPSPRTGTGHFTFQRNYMHDLPKDTECGVKFNSGAPNSAALDNKIETSKSGVCSDAPNTTVQGNTITEPKPASPPPITLQNSPGSAVSVNQTGGITAGTIYDYVPPQRTLKPEDEASLMSALSQHPGKVTVGAFGTDPSSEPHKFALKIQQIFSAAGWTLVEPDISPMYSSQPWTGVMIDAKGKKGEPLPANAGYAVRALQGAHIKPIHGTPHPEWTDETFVLVTVGANPEN